MPSVEKEKSNRPEDTPFKQQRLRAWQPILTPNWVIGTFLVVGLVFVPIGFVLKSESDRVYEHVVTYDQKDTAALEGIPSECFVNDHNDGYFDLVNNTEVGKSNPFPYSCTLEFPIDREIKEEEEIFVYFQLDNFFQNHRRYVKSRSDLQLRNEEVNYEDLASSCDPVESFKVNSENEADYPIYYPCGLIATSYFNDAFLMDKIMAGDKELTYTHGSPDDETSPSLKETGIAWESDLDKKFKNPSGERANDFEKFSYLWQHYDQMSCYLESDLTVRTKCITWEEKATAIHTQETTSLSHPVVGSGCAECAPGSRAVYQGGIPPPTDSKNELSNQGIRNEHFIVWMRTAGLPVFRKLYGSIQPPKGGFKEGDKITFNVVSNFEVGSFDGKKSLVLATISPLGGKNVVLGVAYIVVGIICMVLAVAFFIKEKISPRKLGDPAYLNWS